MKPHVDRWCMGLVLLVWAAAPAADRPGPGVAGLETKPAVPATKPAVPEVERALPDMLPEGTLVYIAWPGIEALGETSKDTALAKMLQEPEVLRFREQWREKVWPAIEGLIAGEIGDDAGVEMYRAAKDLAAGLWRYPTVIGVIGVGFGETGPQVDGAVVVRAGPDAGQLVERVEHLVQGAGLPTAAAAAVPVTGARLKELPLGLPTLPLRWGVIGEDVVVSVGTRMLDYLTAGGEVKGLGQSERFAQAMKIIGGGPDAPTLFVDVKGIVTTLETFQPMLAGFGVPVLGQEGGVQKILDESGFATAESVSMVTVPEAGGFKTSIFLHAPGLGASATPALVQKPLTDADLAVVPKDASWASVSNFDLLGFYQALLSALETLGPDAHTNLIKGIDEVQEQIGLKIEDDLLAAFGDTWAIFDAPSHGGLWITGMTLVVEVKPGNQLDAALKQIIGVLAEEAGSDAGVTVRTEEYRGQAISFVNVTGIPMPVAPAWAEYQGRWIAALYPQMVRVTLDHLIDKTPSLPANPDFARGRKLMPAKPYAIHYADTPASVRQLYSIALPIGQVLMAMGQGQGIPIDVSMLPTMQTVTRHLFGTVSATAAVQDGLLSVSHGPLPGAAAGISEGAVAAPVMVSVLLPSLARARELSRRTVSAANLKAIGVACLIYAESHQGQLPPDLETLTEGGKRAYLLPKQLVSPTDKTGSEISYVYVDGQDNTNDPRNVVAYEKPENYGGEGTNVLFLDGHVEFMTMRGFEKALAETNKNLGRTVAPPAELK